MSLLDKLQKKMLTSSQKQNGIIAALVVTATALVLYIVNAAAQGVIGSFASDKLLPWLVTLLTTTRVPFFVSLILSIAVLGSGYACWQIRETKNKEIESISDISSKLISMDTSVFWWMQKMKDAQSISVDELDKVTKKAIEFLLGTATQMFHQDVYSGAFFAVDDHNVLKIWAHYRMTQEDVEDKDIQFDLTQSVKPPIGMARASYINRRIEVGHIEEDGNGWKCTNGHYIRIGMLGGPTQGEFPRPPYSSLICVPVIYSLKKQQDPLGVVCFYSNERGTFDDPKINRLAEQIVERTSEALEFYHYLKK